MGALCSLSPWSNDASGDCWLHCPAHCAHCHQMGDHWVKDQLRHCPGDWIALGEAQEGSAWEYQEGPKINIYLHTSCFWGLIADWLPEESVHRHLQGGGAETSSDKLGSRLKLWSDWALCMHCCLSGVATWKCQCHVVLETIWGALFLLQTQTSLLRGISCKEKPMFIGYG